MEIDSPPYPKTTASPAQMHAELASSIEQGLM